MITPALQLPQQAQLNKQIQKNKGPEEEANNSEATSASDFPSDHLHSTSTPHFQTKAPPWELDNHSSPSLKWSCIRGNNCLGLTNDLNNHGLDCAVVPPTRQSVWKDSVFVYWSLTNLHITHQYHSYVSDIYRIITQRLKKTSPGKHNYIMVPGMKIARDQLALSDHLTDIFSAGSKTHHHHISAPSLPIASAAFEITAETNYFCHQTTSSLIILFG